MSDTTASSTRIKRNNQEGAGPKSAAPKAPGRWARIVRALETSLQANEPVIERRPFEEAVAIAKSEMAELLADGARLVLSPCTGGWVASCRFDEAKPGCKERAWTLAIFDVGTPVTMRYPAIGLRYVIWMVEREAEFARSPHFYEKLASSSPTVTEIRSQVRREAHLIPTVREEPEAAFEPLVIAA